jgi:pimeloyl-ACP methyl ester carboxylesterase
MMEARMIVSDRLNIHVAGEGKPTLLFVHGFGCALDDWKAQIEALSPTFRCVALDLPGHGASAMPEVPTMAALVSAVNVAKKQSKVRDVILVGHSLGAKVVTEAYCESTADVVGLVLIEGRFYADDPDVSLKRAKDSIDSVGFGAFAQRLFAEMFVESSDPELKERILGRVRKLDNKFGRDLYLEAVARDPARGKDRLRQIAVPVVVLQSTYVNSEFKRMPLQPGMTTPFIELLANLVKESEARVITGCGHFCTIEAADAVNRAIHEFATRISKRDNSTDMRT